MLKVDFMRDLIWANFLAISFEIGYFEIGYFTYNQPEGSDSDSGVSGLLHT